jgi:phosphatidylserine/phosphatidylglycerophosphate/cardiolipin synthase-like enzyme/uncharacterized membrane protein YdjX (TVP38/TMEM64 family)
VDVQIEQSDSQNLTSWKDERSVWRSARADRLSVFYDVASCFSAMRSSITKAQRSITIVGWDIDSRTPIVGRGRRCTDGLPDTLGPFLKAITQRNPALAVRLLLWDFSTLYALEREAFPRHKLNWDGVELQLDATLPSSASQHQKLVIVDDAVAYSGGLDLTIRRWDTADHPFACPERCDPAGTPYDPFHDVQAIVDGDAARALAELSYERWYRATGDRLTAQTSGDPWPDGVESEFTDIDVAISRTLPETEHGPACREVEALFLRMIQSAEREIYIENQYLTSMVIADALAHQLQRNPQLNVLIVAPKDHSAWLEALTMRNGRIRFAERVKAAGGERVRLVGPVVHRTGRSKPVMIHSKVMIIDDAILRIGSANLNNRSMGTDSECDLTITAETPKDKSRVRQVRSRLLSVHAGTTIQKVDEALNTHGLVAGSRLLGGGTHRLADIDDGAPLPQELAEPAALIGDPERPVDAVNFLAEITGDAPASARKRAAVTLAGLGAIMVMIAFGWGWFAHESEVLVGQLFGGAEMSVPAIMTALLLFIVASLMFLPITLLIAGSTAAMGLQVGILVAAIGTLASSMLAYGFGRYGGQRLVRPLLGGRLLTVRNAIVRNGVLSIAAIRMVPLAPFTLVNMAAGAINVAPSPFLFGTILGMAPGFIILALLGRQLHTALAQPSWPAALMVLALVVLWGAVTLATQHIARSRKLLHG